MAFSRFLHKKGIKMKHHLSLMAVCCMAWGNIFASQADTSTSVQPKTEAVSVKKADNLFAGQQFRAALNGYAKAYGANNSSPDLNFKMGLCYHHMGEHPELCETYFTAAAKKYSFKYNFYNSKNSNTSFDANTSSAKLI